MCLRHSLHTITSLLLAWLLVMTGMASAADGKSPAPSKSATAAPEYDKLLLPDLEVRAERGDVRAQFELGSRYNYGRGVPRSAREALRWLRRAAQAGHTDAQRLLAVKLFNGYDVVADHEEAFRWAQRLAESGDVPAQLMLASMYANGEGVSRNLVRSYMWYAIAAGYQPRDEDAESLRIAVQKAAEQRELTARLLLPEEEAEAQALAIAWWRAYRQRVEQRPVKKR